MAFYSTVYYSDKNKISSNLSTTSCIGFGRSDEKWCHAFSGGFFLKIFLLSVKTYAAGMEVPQRSPFFHAVRRLPPL
jgi:hypothetical protein